MRAVVALHTDGSMAGWFPSMVIAYRKYRIPRDAIWRSIKTGKPYKGFKWVDKEVFDKHYRACTLDKLAYKKNTDRDEKGHWVKGHKTVKCSERTKKILAKYASIQSTKQALDPNSKWGKGRPRRVWCANNDKEYNSITEAANDLGLTQYQISCSLYCEGKTKGFKFYRI